MISLKEDMSGIKFQSRWFERCLKEFDENSFAMLYSRIRNLEG